MNSQSYTPTGVFFALKQALFTLPGRKHQETFQFPSLPSEGALNTPYSLSINLTLG